jgi:DNA-binding response OmpR family regulator
MATVEYRGPAGLATDTTPQHTSRESEYHREGPLGTLIVDPNIEAATQLAVQLHRAGFQCYVASSGSAACTAVQAQYFRSLIVVADLYDKRDARHVRDLRTFAPRSWLIVISTRSDQAALELVQRCGGDALITTPFGMTTLNCKLAEFSRRPRLGI